MTDQNKADNEPVVPATTEQPAVQPNGEQDPLKTELERVQRKPRSKAEKLLFTKKRIDEQLKELGIDEEPQEQDDQPVTVGMLKKMQAETAQKTALDLANEVSNETERELLIYHLENTIRSTGNPQEDFKLAQGLVNAVKNQQIIEESLRKPPVRSHPTGNGAPAKEVKIEEEFTPEEQAYMKPPFNLSKEKILEIRKVNSK